MLTRLIAPLTLALTAVMPVRAGNSDSMQLTGLVYREVVTRDGNGAVRRALAPATRLASGDRLVFVIRYRNLGTTPVNDYTVASPFPTTVRYEDDPRQPIEVSLDSGRSWGRLGALVIPTDTRNASREDRVTNVRLRLRAPVRPGDTGQLSYCGTVR